MIRLAIRCRKARIVGDEDECQAGTNQELFEPFDGGDVEVVCRLVEQQHRRISRRGPSPGVRGGFIPDDSDSNRLLSRRVPSA